MTGMPPILAVQQPTAASRASEAQKSSAAAYARAPHAYKPVSAPVLAPHVVPARPVYQLTKKPAFAGAKPKLAPPGMVTAAGKIFPTALHAGHYVVKNGQWQLIHAVGKNQWVAGGEAGAVAPTKPSVKPIPQGLAKAPAFAAKPGTMTFKIGGTPFHFSTLSPAPHFSTVPYEPAWLNKAASPKLAALHMSAPSTKSGGGGGFLGFDAISPGGLLHTVEHAAAPVGHVVGNLGKDIINLPHDTLQAVEQLGPAVLHDMVSGVKQTFTGHPFAHEDRTVNLVRKMAKYDPLTQLVTHPTHPGRALKLAEAHPLAAITDVLPVAKGIGMGVGKAADAGVLGEAAKGVRAGKSIRVPLMKGTKASMETRLSPNFVTAALQHKMYGSLTNHPTGLGRAVVNTMLRKSEALQRVGNRHRLHAMIQSVDKNMHPTTGVAGKVRHLNAETAALAPHVAGYGLRHADLAALAARLHREAHIASQSGRTARAASLEGHVQAILNGLTSKRTDWQALTGINHATRLIPEIGNHMQHMIEGEALTSDRIPSWLSDITRPEKGAMRINQGILPPPGLDLLKAGTFRGATEAAHDLDLGGLVKRYGPAYPTRTEATLAAEKIAENTGHEPPVPIAFRGKYHLVPEAAQKEFENQIKQDYPGAGARGYLAATRQYRNTLLAFNPKLPIMHTAESTTRTALRSGLRAPLDIKRAQRVLNSPELDYLEQAHLKGMNTPGAQTARAGDPWAEDMRTLLKTNSAHRPVAIMQRAWRGYNSTAQGIIHAQRSLVKLSEQASFGREGRLMARDLGHSILESNSVGQQLADEIARGLRDPAKAEQFARSMHKSMGQYQAFTSRTNKVLRFTPFLPWYLNATRLVMSVLPRDHPAVEAMLQDQAHAGAQDWQKQHKGLPGYMQDYMPLGGAKYMDVGKFTPVGVPNMTPESIGTELAGLAGGPLGGPAQALAGIGPFGRRFKPGYTSKADYKAGVKTLMKQGLTYKQAQNKITTFMQGSAFSGEPGDFGKGLGMAAESGLSTLTGPIPQIARGVYGKGESLSNISQPTIRMLSGGKLGRIERNAGTSSRGLLHLPTALDRLIDPFHPMTYTGKPPTPKRGRSGAFGSGAFGGGSSKSAFGASVSDAGRGQRFVGGPHRPHRPLVPGGSQYA
jgi:hypothetical protein